MRCIICGSGMSYYFSKQFDLHNLGLVDYHHCAECGFCASLTHFEMSDKQWEQINDDFHSVTHHTDQNPYNRNQRYFHQAQMLHLAKRFGLVGPNWLDWGCGVGAVSKLLDRLYGEKLLTYDKFYTPEINAVPSERLKPRAFDLVLSTAVIEHVRDRATLDEIESYTTESGCLAIHTLVPETVPKDPEWMYLLPVHTAFHTNRSMQLLMDQWGYQCSVYNELAKLWLMFKSPAKEVQPKVEELNRFLGWDYLKFKPGFMDYWK